jgi:hypothetical protein
MPSTNDEVLKAILPDDEHILHMGDEDVTLPDWFIKHNKMRLMFASGDWVRNHVPNTEEFKKYDIHTCYPLTDMPNYRPDGNYFDMEKNLQYIIDHFYHQRLIVIMDLSNITHVERFVRLFRNSIYEINTLERRLLGLYCINFAHIAAGVLHPTGIIMNAVCDEVLNAYGLVCENLKCRKSTMGGRRKQRNRKTQRRRRNLKK